MGQENIPLTVKGLPDEDKITEKDFSHLPAAMQASLAHIAEVRERRSKAPAKSEFTKQQIADAEKNATFHAHRQQD